MAEVPEHQWVVPSGGMHIDEGDIEAVSRVLRRGVLSNGPEVAALEREFAAYCGVEHVVAVSSGTAALVTAGQALGLARGDTVLVAGFTFAATANAFLSLGCRVLPLDVAPATMNADPRDLVRALTEHPDTRAVVVVDLFGNPSGIDEAIAIARRRGVQVIEDAAQAHGAEVTPGCRVGTRADATTFSLYATKNMAAGEGGLVCTPHGGVARDLRLLRNHGGLTPYGHEVVGLNHRLPEMSASLGRRQLARLDSGNACRRGRARELARWCRHTWGGDIVTPEAAGADDTGHVFHQFTVQFSTTDLRDRTASALREQGIEARQFYPYIVGELPGVEPRPTPVCERLRDTVLSLPVHPALGRDQWGYMREALRSCPVPQAKR